MESHSASTSGNQIVMRRPHTLIIHALAKLVPPISAEARKELVEDIKAHGVQVPLDCLGDTVLDGRTRLEIAITLDLKEVPTRQVDLGREDAVSYMIRMAAMRRHLSDDQRAMLAARLTKLIKKPTGAAAHQDGSNSGPHRPRVGDGHPARKEASKLMNVPEKKTKTAISVERADPEMADRVANGEIPLRIAKNKAGSKRDSDGSRSKLPGDRKPSSPRDPAHGDSSKATPMLQAPVLVTTDDNHRFYKCGGHDRPASIVGFTFCKPFEHKFPHVSGVPVDPSSGFLLLGIGCSECQKAKEAGVPNEDLLWLLVEAGKGLPALLETITFCCEEVSKWPKKDGPSDEKSGEVKSC